MVTLYIDDGVKALAADKLASWFGEEPVAPKD